jgi:hypothetical protein
VFIVQLKENRWQICPADQHTAQALQIISKQKWTLSNMPCLQQSDSLLFGCRPCFALRLMREVTGRETPPAVVEPTISLFHHEGYDDSLSLRFSVR